MSHVHCYIFTSPSPPTFLGPKKCNLQFSLPPLLIVSYHFSAPPTKTKAKGVGMAAKEISMRVFASFF